jgi:arylsulfatase A-like enzyme
MRHGLQVGVVRPWAEFGLPLDERTLPQALREAGYHTAIFGKWHLGHARPEFLPTRRGFDRQYGHYNGALDHFTHVRDGGFDWHRDDKVCRDEGYTTTLIARETVQFINGQDASKPFFAYVPFTAVHAPLQVPEEYKKPYSHLGERRAIYAGMLAALDEAVGQIVSAVDARGWRTNTLILFSTDNGGPNPKVLSSNAPFRAGKGSVYEGGVRACAFANWPGKISANTVVNTPLHIVDWYPTLLKLAGAKLEQKLPVDGRDCWPAIGEGKKTRTEVLINASPRQGALRLNDWKLVVNGEVQTADEDEDQEPHAGSDKIELFNLAEDPSETKNLALDHPDKARELRARYDTLARQQIPPKIEPKPRGFRSPKIWGEHEGN